MRRFRLTTSPSNRLAVSLLVVLGGAAGQGWLFSHLADELRSEGCEGEVCEGEGSLALPGLEPSGRTGAGTDRGQLGEPACNALPTPRRGCAGVRVAPQVQGPAHFLAH